MIANDVKVTVINQDLEIQNGGFKTNRDTRRETEMTKMVNNIPGIVPAEIHMFPVRFS